MPHARLVRGCCSGVEQVGAVGQLPQAIADETAVGYETRALAPRDP